MNIIPLPTKKPLLTEQWGELKPHPEVRPLLIKRFTNRVSLATKDEVLGELEKRRLGFLVERGNEQPLNVIKRSELAPWAGQLFLLDAGRADIMIEYHSGMIAELNKAKDSLNPMFIAMQVIQKNELAKAQQQLGKSMLSAIAMAYICGE